MVFNIQKTLDKASLSSSESETQYDHKLTSTPYGSHRDLGIGPNISKFVQKYRYCVWIEQPKNYPTLPAKQPENYQANTTNIAHVVHPRIQWHD